MELIDNINKLLGDDLKAAIAQGGRLRVAASCFSIYAFSALKDELGEGNAEASRSAAHSLRTP